MAKIQYVALLRGINVGGNNVIKMAELKACLDAKGFGNVVTYIQSGNVLFEADETDQAKLAQKVSNALTEAFGYRTPVVLHSHKDMRRIVHGAPKDFGNEPAKYRYDVIFLKEPLTPTEAMRAITLRDGVDQAATGLHVLYFSRLTSRAAQSRLTRIIALPIYQNMTIRNWNTTTKLLALLENRAQIRAV